MLLDWVMTIILWNQPDLRQLECVEGDVACEQENAERGATLSTIAETTIESAERETMDLLIGTGVQEKESGWRANPCDHKVRLSRILARIPIEDMPGHETIRWRCWRGDDPNGTCERQAYRVREHGAFLRFDTCRASEAGHMQVLLRGPWGRGGVRIIPEMQVEVLTDLADGERTQFPIEGTYDYAGVYVDGEYVRRCRQGRGRWCVAISEEDIILIGNRSRAFAPEAGVAVEVTEVLNEDPDLRRIQMMDPEINIPLGFRELAFHRDNWSGNPDEWWRGIGAYNTGSYRGEQSREYARRILGNYARYCSTLVKTADGDQRLREVWPGCEAAEAAWARMRDY